MLTDSEVDRRFFQLVADLNSTALPVDWPCVSDPAEQLPPDETDASSVEKPGTGALRLVAVVSIVVLLAVGVAVVRAWGLGFSFFALWLGVVVPAITLITLLAVDRLRRR